MTAGELAHVYPGVVRALARAEAIEQAHIRENAIHRRFLRLLIGVLVGAIAVTLWNLAAGWQPASVYGLISVLTILVALWLNALRRARAHAD